MFGKISLMIVTLVAFTLYVHAQTQTEPQTLQTMPAPKLEAKSGTPIATFKGTGNETTKSFDLKKGEATFKVLLDWEKRDPDLQPGEGKFAVDLADEEGKEVEPVIATIGHFDGARTIKVAKAGKYKIKVTAPGSWTINVEQ
jgi:hypothetical protein